MRLLRQFSSAILQRQFRRVLREHFRGSGWASLDGSAVSPNEYESHALDIAHQICECLRDEGFEPGWDGSFSRKIEVTLNWQRRSLLE